MLILASGQTRRYNALTRPANRSCQGPPAPQRGMKRSWQMETSARRTAPPTCQIPGQPHVTNPGGAATATARLSWCVAMDSLQFSIHIRRYSEPGTRILAWPNKAYHHCPDKCCTPLSITKYPSREAMQTALELDPPCPWPSVSVTIPLRVSAIQSFSIEGILFFSLSAWCNP